MRESGSGPSLKDGLSPGALLKCTWYLDCPMQGITFLWKSQENRKLQSQTVKFNMTPRVDIAPAGAQGSYILHCFLAWYSLFSEGSCTGWYLYVRKGHLFLFLLEWWVLQQLCFCLRETDPCKEEIRPLPLSSARFRHSLATSNEMSAVRRLETMSSFGCKHLCSVFSSALKPMARENLGHWGRC